MKCCVMDSTSICNTLDVIYFRYKVTADAAAGHEKKLSFGNCSRMGTYFSVRVPDLGQIDRSFWGKKNFLSGKVANLKIDLARFAARPCHESQSLSSIPVDAGNQFVGFTTVIYKRGLKSAWCRPRCWRRSMRPSAARTKAGSPHSFFMRKCGSFFAARNQEHVKNFIVL